MHSNRQHCQQLTAHIQSLYAAALAGDMDGVLHSTGALAVCVQAMQQQENRTAHHAARLAAQMTGGKTPAGEVQAGPPSSAPLHAIIAALQPEGGQGV